jgi:DNA-binding transcriptional regulator GbsR (MarR family)
VLFHHSEGEQMSVKCDEWHGNDESVAEVYDLMLNGKSLTIYDMAEEVGIYYD